jgi:hypothetical protein
MSDTKSKPDGDSIDPDPPIETGLPSFTIFWKENPSSPLVKTKTIHATDLETAWEAAHFLIFLGSGTISVVVGVVPD